MTRFDLKIQSIIYGNPGYYPPMIYTAAVFDKLGIQQHLLQSHFVSERLPIEDVIFPESTQIIKVGPQTTGGGKAFASFVWAVLRHASGDCDAVIGYDMHGFLCAFLVAKRFGKPLIYHNHDFVDNWSALSIGQRLIKWLETSLARYSDIVVVPDQSRAEYIKEKLRLKVNPIVVANAALVQPTQNDPTLQHELVKRGHHFEKVIFRQGAIGKGHALEVTIESIKYWNNPKWGFVIMGPVDPDYRQALYQLASDESVENQFVILPAVSFNRVREFTSGASIGHALYDPLHINNKFILTASNKILEYIAAEIPLLLSNSSDNHAFLEKYPVGVIADSNSPQDIAHAINQICENDDLVARARTECKRAFEEEFNYTTQMQPLIKAISDLVRKNDV